MSLCISIELPSQESEQQLRCPVCSRTFTSEAMFRKHQQQAHRSSPSASSDPKDIAIAGAKLEVALELDEQIERELDPPMTTFYSCTVCKMIFSSVAEIQEHVSEADCGRRGDDSPGGSSLAGGGGGSPLPPPAPQPPIDDLKREAAVIAANDLGEFDELGGHTHPMSAKCFE